MKQCRLLSFDDFSKECGLSTGTLRMLRHRHGLSVVKLGARVYIDPADFAEWVNKHKTAAPPLVEDTAPRVEEPKKRRASKTAGKMHKIY